MSDLDAQTATAKAVVYTTTDDEREAREIAEDLWAKQRRKAVVRSVNEMSQWGDATLINPGALHTTDRYAVIAETRRTPYVF